MLLCTYSIYPIWHGCTEDILAKYSSISLNIEGEFTLDIRRCWRQVFLVAVPALWNMIHLKLQLATNFVEFKKALKTILFLRPLDTQGLHNWTFIGCLFAVTFANIALLTVTNERLLFWLICSYTLSRVAQSSPGSYTLSRVAQDSRYSLQNNANINKNQPSPTNASLSSLKTLQNCSVFKIVWKIVKESARLISGWFVFYSLNQEAMHSFIFACWSHLE